MVWNFDIECKPESHWHVVLVTDGELVCLARWINDPVEWYGKDLEDEDGEKLDSKWHEAHWLFLTQVGPFTGNDECFGAMNEIIGWMDIPKPSNEEIK